MLASPASLSRRLASMLYEGLVVFAVLLIFFWLPQTLLSSAGFVVTPRLLWIHILVLFGFYFVWFWLNSGQTLPMKTWRLQLVNEQGNTVRPAQAIFRYLVAWPSIVFFGIGILWSLLDKDGLFLHDRLAGTRIIEKPAAK